MPIHSPSHGGSIIPTLTFRDAPAAIEWLCRAFGFRQHLVVPGPGGTIAHAELTLGAGMIMLGSTKEEGFGRLQKSPRDVGGVGTQSAYLVVAAIDAHYAQARAPAPRSCSTSRTRTTAAVATPAVIPKGISGASGATIRGPSRLSRPA